MRLLAVSILAAHTAVTPLTASAQERPGRDYEPILEVGVAAEHDLTEHASYGGGEVAVEVTPVEHWLELELGISAVRSTSQTEIGADLLFKKPYRLSSAVEFMFGVGPTLASDLQGPPSGAFLGAEAMLDFMFWPWRGHIGWYVEPGYGVAFHSGTTRSLGLTAGLLVRLR